ncbi:MAG: PTS sugar transporter subunit IIA [Alphaproteobacteria bacterium]|nr:PTS sugar transporter subunit IIA [Alphaproteobacteria bacterium]
MITADLIIPALEATSKKKAFRAIAEEIAAQIGGHADDLLGALLDRERIGSTGIGQGVAIPHIKIAGAERMYGVLVRLETPVDYDAIDSLPVDIIFMLLAPAESKTTQHLKMLAQISRFLKDSKTCDAIRASAETETLSAILTEWASSQAA